VGDSEGSRWEIRSIVEAAVGSKSGLSIQSRRLVAQLAMRREKVCMLISFDSGNEERNNRNITCVNMFSG
jgi:hypothetical protein